MAREHGCSDSKAKIQRVVSDLGAARSNALKAAKAVDFVASTALVYVQACQARQPNTVTVSKKLRAGKFTTAAEAQAALTPDSASTFQIQLLAFPETEHEFAFWGVKYLTTLPLWLQPLQWPTGPAQQDEANITWSELWLDFLISTQINVPWNQGGSKADPRYSECTLPEIDQRT